MVDLRRPPRAEDASSWQRQATVGATAVANLGGSWRLMDTALQLALEEFSQVFASAQNSSGWVRVRATLIDPSPQGNVLLAQQVFEVRQPATSANAAGGVQALSAGVDQVGQQLGAWLQTVLVAPR